MTDPRFRVRCDTCGADAELGLRARAGWEDRHDDTHDYEVERVDDPDPDKPLNVGEASA